MRLVRLLAQKPGKTGINSKVYECVSRRVYTVPVVTTASRHIGAGLPVFAIAFRRTMTAVVKGQAK